MSNGQEEEKPTQSEIEAKIEEVRQTKFGGDENHTKPIQRDENTIGEEELPEFVQDIPEVVDNQDQVNPSPEKAPISQWNDQEHTQSPAIPMYSDRDDHEQDPDEGDLVKPPFWSTLSDADEDEDEEEGEEEEEKKATGLLTMEDGFVIVRLYGSGEAMETILPGGIPKDVAVTGGDVFTCRLTEDSLGKITEAEIEKSNEKKPDEWPESTAPVLAGGGNYGSSGARHIRLCSIDEEKDEEGDPKLVVKVWNTGHIDHFQPSLLENHFVSENPSLGSSASGAHPVTQGQILSGFSNGKWILRNPSSGLGQLTITQDKPAKGNLEFRGNKKDSNLIVWEGDGAAYGNSMDTVPIYSTDSASGAIYANPYERPSPLAEFRDGLNTTGNIIVGNEAGESPPQPKDLEILIPTVVAGSGITVADMNTGKGGKIYKITATGGTTSTLTSPISGHTIATHNSGAGGAANVDINETITDLSLSGSTLTYSREAGADRVLELPDGLPTGTNGQILRNVSGVWTAVNVTEVTLSYCASGTPTTGTFLKL
jgi:hypothetical protein